MNDDATDMLHKGAASPRRTEGPGTILLVDDEDNILSALKRVLRRDGYRLLVATSGSQGLETLALEDVDVIISDQRMPEMTGTRFLQEARKLKPDTVRIVLSGYTELESVTSAINEGSVYKFLTKPWDDEQLRSNIAEAMRHKRMTDENLRLQRELRQANESLQQLLAERERQVVMGQMSLLFAQETMASLPIAVIGIDVEGLIALANDAAQRLLANSLVGVSFDEVLPAELIRLVRDAPSSAVKCSIDRRAYRVCCTTVGSGHNVRGKVLTFVALHDLEPLP